MPPGSCRAGSRRARSSSALLRRLGEELGRTPTARDLDERRGAVPSKSLYWHTFGSFATALREAGFDVAVGEERLERAVEQGADARALRRAPPEVRRLERSPAGGRSLLTEWQVYRMFEARRGAWATFQFLVARPSAREGVDVALTARCRRR